MTRSFCTARVGESSSSPNTGKNRTTRSRCQPLAALLSAPYRPPPTIPARHCPGCSILFPVYGPKTSAPGSHLRRCSEEPLAHNVHSGRRASIMIGACLNTHRRVARRPSCVPVPPVPSVYHDKHPNARHFFARFKSQSHCKYRRDGQFRFLKY